MKSSIRKMLIAAGGPIKKIKTRDINGNWVYMDISTGRTTSAGPETGTIRTNAVNSVGGDVKTKQGRTKIALKQATSYNNKLYKVHNYADTIMRLKLKHQNVVLDKQGEPKIVLIDYVPALEAPMQIVSPEFDILTLGGITGPGNFFKTVKNWRFTKIPNLKFTTAKSIYNEGNMTPLEVLLATGKGIKDVYKTYSPGGAWYQRQLANGVSKEEVDRLASEYLKNLRKTTFKVTDSPLSDAVAVTGGEIRNGEIIPKITMDPKYAPNALLVRSAASHEGGHASTLNLEPKNSPYREPEHEGFYLLVEKENPEITKAMEYNESLRPNIKDSALDEVLLDETGNAERHINNVISSQEIRQRALASEIDASNKGVTMNEYINNPNLWDLNFKQLNEIFDKEGLKNYMKYYKSTIPIIGGYTLHNLLNSLNLEYQKQGGKMNTLEYLKNGSGIHIKKKNRGKFTDYCGGKVTNSCIAKAKASGNPTLVKRATFAANARKWKH